MSYDNAEPKTLKTLNSKGQVLNDSGNVISETSDYWKQVYEQSEPKVDKILHSDGTIKDAAGNLIQDTTEFNVKKYNQAEPIPAKYLHADGTIDENPGSGSDIKVQNNKDVSIEENGEIEITPDDGYDAVKKVTATINVQPEQPVTPSGDGSSYDIHSGLTSGLRLNAYSKGQSSGYIYVFGTPKVGDIAYQFISSGEHNNPKWVEKHISEVSETHEYPFTGSIFLEEYPDVEFMRNGYADISTVTQ